MVSPLDGVGMWPSKSINNVCSNLVTQEPSSFTTKSPDEGFIAGRYSFGSIRHVFRERQGISFGSSVARGNTVSETSTSSMSRGNRTSGVGRSDGDDAVGSHQGTFQSIVSYINAEGKAREDDQVAVIIESVERQSKDWLCIFISEADFLELQGFSETFVCGHLCKRQSVAGGRAQKVVINKKFSVDLVQVVWQGRSARADFKFQTNRGFSLVSVVGSHFAHGEGWDDSCDIHHLLIRQAPRGASTYAVADFNVELRESKQQPLDKARARCLQSAAAGLGLVQAFMPSDTCETRRPSGLAALLSTGSCLDMAFVPFGSSASTSVSWDGAPGDHGFVHAGICESFCNTSTRIGLSVWRCSDPDAYGQYVDDNCPPDFSSVSQFNTFLKDAMDLFTDRRTSRERRREWEPERVKELRRQ